MIKRVRYAGVGVLALSPSLAMAAADISQAFVKLSDSIAPLINISQGIVFWIATGFLGVCMGIRTAYKLKQHSDNPSHHPLSGVVASFFTTAALLALPLAMDAMRNSLGLTEMASNPLGYINQTQTSMPIERAVYIYAAFFGYIAFIRGIFILNKLGEPSKRGDELGRGITHLIGAVGATNLAEIVGALKSLFL